VHDDVVVASSSPESREGKKDEKQKQDGSDLLLDKPVTLSLKEIASRAALAAPRHPVCTPAAARTIILWREGKHVHLSSSAYFLTLCKKPLP